MKVKVTKSSKECRNKKKIVCPFCGYVDEDSHLVTESESSAECPNCERFFDLDVKYTLSYSTSPVDINIKKWGKGDSFDDGLISQKEEDYSNAIFKCEAEDDR